jgi:hypothetical protein
VAAFDRCGGAQAGSVASEVPTIPEGEGEGEAWFNRNSKPHGGGAH